MSSHGGKGKAYDIAFMGLMLALALALSFLESLLPVLPFLPVGVKLGLSNTIENLKTRAEGIHPQGLATLAWLNERKNEIC